MALPRPCYSLFCSSSSSSLLLHLYSLSKTPAGLQAVRKLHGHLKAVKESAVERTLPQAKVINLTPQEQSLDEDLNEAAQVRLPAYLLPMLLLCVIFCRFCGHRAVWKMLPNNIAVTSCAGTMPGNAISLAVSLCCCSIGARIVEGMHDHIPPMQPTEPSY